MLEAPGYLAVDLTFFQNALEASLNLTDVGLALLLAPGDTDRELPALFREQGTERQIFELALDPADPEAIGQRRIDL